MIKHKHHLTRIEEVELVPELESTLIKLQTYGFRLGIVTNQSVISRGLASFDEVDSINKFITSSLQAKGIQFDYILVCPHKPEDNCQCRKPKTGLIDNLDSRLAIDVERSYMVGDNETDVLFGKTLGMKTILISMERPSRTLADFVISSLKELPNIVHLSAKNDNLLP